MHDDLDAVVRRYGHPPCSNCGWLVWVDNFKSADTLCGRCGSVQDRIRVAGPCYRDLFDGDGNRRVGGGPFETFPTGACINFDYQKVDQKLVSDGDKKSPPYKRATYLNERLKQWKCEEPPICDKDWECIRTEWQWFVDRGARQQGVVLEKEGVRSLLKLIDKWRMDVGKRPRFVRKYLVSVISFVSCAA